MQPHSNATIGAWTLGTAAADQVGDARASFELVGSMTLDRAAAGTTASAAGGQDAVLNPITAARQWLADPDRRAVLAPALVARAEASVLVAERWFQEIDTLANELATAATADGSGELDPDGLERIDHMVDVLATYSLRMRELLDPESPAPDADARISGALAASRAGGLAAFVEAL